MSRAGQAVLKTLAITVAVLFAMGVALLGVTDLYFGSSKVRPLFGMSADALAGPADAGPDLSAPKPEIGWRGLAAVGPLPIAVEVLRAAVDEVTLAIAAAERGHAAEAWAEALAAVRAVAIAVERGAGQ